MTPDNWWSILSYFQDLCILRVRRAVTLPCLPKILILETLSLEPRALIDSYTRYVCISLAYENLVWHLLHPIRRNFHKRRALGQRKGRHFSRFHDTHTYAMYIDQKYLYFISPSWCIFLPSVFSFITKSVESPLCANYFNLWQHDTCIGFCALFPVRHLMFCACLLFT